MKCYWNKIAMPEEAYALYECLFDTYGPEYTGDWYSVCFPRNGYMNHSFTVQADSDDPTMLKLGFELVHPVNQTP